MTLQNRLRQGASISRERQINLDFAKIADEAADRIDVLEAIQEVLLGHIETINKCTNDPSIANLSRAVLAGIKEVK
jgi:hypothetical protein